MASLLLDESNEGRLETAPSLINIKLPENIFIYHLLPLLSIRDIGPVKQVCKKWLEYVRQYFRYLKVLDLTPWDSMGTEELLCSVAVYAVNLQVLRLDSCWRAATESSILTVAKTCHRLKEFSACRCGSVTDLAISTLTEKCPNITEIDLSSCYRVTDESLCAIATNAKNLRQLHVSSNYGVSDFGVSQLAFKCLHLQVLDVSFCYKVSDLGLEGFLSRSSLDSSKDGQCQLKNLRIKDCAKVTDVMVARLTSIGIQVNNMF